MGEKRYGDKKVLAKVEGGFFSFFLMKFFNTPFSYRRGVGLNAAPTAPGLAVPLRTRVIFSLGLVAGFGKSFLPRSPPMAPAFFGPFAPLDRFFGVVSGDGSDACGVFNGDALRSSCIARNMSRYFVPLMPGFLDDGMEPLELSMDEDISCHDIPMTCPSVDVCCHTKLSSDDELLDPASDDEALGILSPLQRFT